MFFSRLHHKLLLLWLLSLAGALLFVGLIFTFMLGHTREQQSLYELEQARQFLTGRWDATRQLVHHELLQLASQSDLDTDGIHHNEGQPELETLALKLLRRLDLRDLDYLAVHDAHGLLAIACKCQGGSRLYAYRTQSAGRNVFRIRPADDEPAYQSYFLPYDLQRLALTTETEVAVTRTRDQLYLLGWQPLSDDLQLQGGIKLSSDAIARLAQRLEYPLLFKAEELSVGQGFESRLSLQRLQQLERSAQGWVGAGDEYYGVIALPSASMDARLIFAVPVMGLGRELETLGQSMLLLLVLALVGFTPLGGVFISRVLTRPLGKLFQAVQRLKEGNYQFIEGFDPKSDLGGLAASFNTMIAALNEREVALKTSSRELRQLSAALEQSPACIIITDLRGLIQYVNPGFCKVTGYTLTEVEGKPVSLLKSSSTHADTFGQLWSALNTQGEWHGELLNQRKNGEPFWVAATISVLRDEQGQPDRYLAIQEDISLRKSYEEQLFHRSNYDGLTDLPNRELIQDRLQQALEMAEAQQHQVAVLFINLLQFRRVNEVQGHEAGDELLRQAARRLQQVLSPLESLGRIGSDEFVVVVPEVSRLQAVEHLSRCMLQQFDMPFQLNDSEVRVPACIGIALYPDDGTHADMLLRHADAAMQQVRMRKESGYCFFLEEMNEHARRSLEMEQALHDALDRGEFELWYQPLLDLKTRRIRGVEALVRWHRPGHGLVPPDDFIPRAEESGQILPLGYWVLSEAIRQVACWQKQLGITLELAVNISPRQILQPNFVEQVKQLLNEHELLPGSLELEITESIFLDVEAEGRIIETLRQLRESGVRLSIDDFGTGFSALGYLKRFPVDILKIDRQFVRDIHLDTDAATLCQAIIWMARGLHMEVIAEGVELAEQLEMLAESGADVAQGYYIAKPQPAQYLPPLFEQFEEVRKVI